MLLTKKLKVQVSTIYLIISFCALFAMTWALCTFHLDFYSAANVWGWTQAIWLYPWTDMVENIIIGFNLANGLRFGH